jgi:hypothetical protein
MHFLSQKKPSQRRVISITPKLLSCHGLKMDIELCRELAKNSPDGGEMHIAAHWLQSTASLFHSKVRNPPRNQAGWSWKANR